MKHTLAILTLFFLIFSASPARAIGPYTDNGDGTVYDQATGLTWQQNTADVNGDNTITSNDYPTGDRATWEQALAYCEGLGNGWRLPNIRELKSLADKTTYSPAIDSHFQCESNYYWSATTNANFADYAWFVYFYYGNDSYLNKTSHYYVRCVRGGLSGGFGQFGSFAFSPISSQSVGVPFQVTITAKTASGLTDTGFNGDVSLTSTVGNVKPTEVRLTNGQATFATTLYNPGTAILSADRGSVTGSSSSFSVTGTGTCRANIYGSVNDLQFAQVAGADVNLYSAGGSYLAHTTTDGQGVFHFDNRTCDNYELRITKSPAPELRRNVAVVADNQAVYHVYGLSLNAGANDTPVILVPGMLGSSRWKNSVYPLLSKKTKKHNLKILMPGHTGFKKLRQVLKGIGAGFTVYDCPWDWRLPAREAAEEYLKPMIDKALADTGASKVHIVAHSMGGLLVRSLIQHSAEYADKIARVAMVGTPNRGSCNAYYIWEGGNPKLIDDISDSGVIGSAINFYTSSLRVLWINTYLKPYWSNLRHKAIRKFVHDKGPSLLELMYTPHFLVEPGVGARGTSGDNINTALNDLNSDGNRYRMSADGHSGTIQTGLFIGKKQKTVTGIRVGARDSGAKLYQDGRPVSKPSETVVRFANSGDGTVPYASSRFPADDGWALLVDDSAPDEHGTLVKYYAEMIKDFLLTGTARSSSSMVAKDAVAQKSSGSANPVFSLTVHGTVRIDVTGPDGNHTGVDADSGDLVQDIAGSSAFFDTEGGLVSMENPVAGVYSITIFGSSDRDFHIDVGYQNDSVTEYYPFWGFYGNDRITFTVTVQNGSAPYLYITPPAGAPTNLQADPTGSAGAETTVLSWEASSEQGVNGYTVYAVGDSAPYFTKLATVSAGTTSYSPNDTWAGDAATPVMTYAVTALKSDGSESFFSNRIQNNDRDHDQLTDVEEAGYGTDPAKPDTDNDGYTDYDEIEAGSNPLDPKSVPTAWHKFPWPMFLPAITGH